jgi:hypothetical protein
MLLSVLMPLRVSDVVEGIVLPLIDVTAEPAVAN